MLKLTMQQIIYFLELCDSLNFTETAKKNYLSQPTLSRQISILEEKVGTQLFVRNHRSVLLTPEGELLRTEFSSFIQQYESLMDSVSQIANHKKGSIKVLFSEYLNMRDLCINYIHPFQKKYPLIQFHCECLNYKELKHRILENEFDLIFMPSYESEAFPEYKSVVVAKEPIGIIISRVNPQFSSEELNPELLNHGPLILLSSSESSGYSRRALSVCKRLGMTPTNLIYTSSISSMFASVECGLGFTVCNTYMAENNPELLKSFTFEQCYPEKINALWKHSNPNFALTMFTETLIEDTHNSDN